MIQKSPAFAFVLSVVAGLFLITTGDALIGAEPPPVEAATSSSDPAATIHLETWTIETRDGETGKPIPNITISIQRWEKAERRQKGRQWREAFKANSNNEGILRLELRNPGGATIRVRDDQYIAGPVILFIGDSPF